MHAIHRHALAATQDTPFDDHCVGVIVLDKQQMNCLVMHYARPLWPCAERFIAASPTAAGNASQNVAPSPIADSTHTRPPCTSMMRFTMASPTPVPSLLISNR